MRKLYSFGGHFLFGAFGVTCFIDHVGFPSAVSGRSMQPCLNPELIDSNGRPYMAKDLVWLNKWKVYNYNLERGDIVAFR